MNIDRYKIQCSHNKNFLERLINGKETDLHGNRVDPELDNYEFTGISATKGIGDTFYCVIGKRKEFID